MGRRVIGDSDSYDTVELATEDAAATAYHSMQSIVHSRNTMTTMLDRPTMITSDMVAIATTSATAASL